MINFYEPVKSLILEINKTNLEKEDREYFKKIVKEELISDYYNFYKGLTENHPMYSVKLPILNRSEIAFERFFYGSFSDYSKFFFAELDPSE